MKIISPRTLRFFIFLLMIVVLLSACGFRKNSRPRLFRPFAVKGVKIVHQADSLVGTPYRWGGESPGEGFDCSGLAYYLYRKNGYSLPRTTTDQLKAGRWVSRRRLKPGDLVFFKVKWFRGYHVGIYGGDGRFIHSPRKGKAVEWQRLDKGYYEDNYYTARRVLS